MMESPFYEYEKFSGPRWEQRRGVLPGWSQLGVPDKSTNVNKPEALQKRSKWLPRIRNKDWEIHGPHKKETVQSTCSFGPVD